ncbi:hypothetical protein FRC11_009990 [Ceratobasidium sp. 423]|nr:hypothetical protein FRC11_009990 [Ceratobasidium sp. 423]
MSGNHFLRSMAEPASHEPEGANSSSEVPEVHFSDTVSVVTEVNKISEAPLVDAPLELTTKDDTDAVKANEQIRRSASRDREMRDEEGLALKAVPREPSEDPPTAPADVAEEVKKLNISSAPSSKKRKSQGETNPAPVKVSYFQFNSYRSWLQLANSCRGATGRAEAANPEKRGMKDRAKPQLDEVLAQGGAIAYPLRTHQRKNSAEVNEGNQCRPSEALFNRITDTQITST